MFGVVLIIIDIFLATTTRLKESIAFTAETTSGKQCYECSSLLHSRHDVGQSFLSFTKPLPIGSMHGNLSTFAMNQGNMMCRLSSSTFLVTL